MKTKRSDSLDGSKLGRLAEILRRGGKVGKVVRVQIATVERPAKLSKAQVELIARWRGHYGGVSERGERL